jgi:hypothetical protein
MAECAINFFSGTRADRRSLSGPDLLPLSLQKCKLSGGVKVLAAALSAVFPSIASLQPPGFSMCNILAFALRASHLAAPQTYLTECSQSQVPSKF